MEPEPSWTDYEYSQTTSSDHTHKQVVDSFAIVEITQSDDEENDAVCINSALPDDILERVLGYLPVATIIKAASVCKKWREMVHPGRFTQNMSSISSRTPWYFMFTSESDPHGHVYDPVLSKWYRFEIPYVETPSWNLVSSSGLLFFADNNRTKLHVCNPITRHCHKIEDPPRAEISDYCAFAISVNKSSENYTLTVVTSKQAPGELVEWDLSINVYRSTNKSWASPVDLTLQAWRGGGDSVICGGVLYFVVYLTRMVGYVRPRHGTLAYDLASESFDLDVDDRVISAPCPVTCMRLISLSEELVMVGGIEKKSRPGVIKGIGIWVLRGNEWEEVSRMPNKFFKGSVKFDDVFASCGFDRLIYIQSYGSPALVMFDMDTKEWSWSHKCPVGKKFPLQLFSGICFQPWLDVMP